MSGIDLSAGHGSRHTIASTQTSIANESVYLSSMEPPLFKMVLFVAVIIASVITMGRGTLNECEGIECVPVLEYQLQKSAGVQHTNLHQELGTERELGVKTDREPIVYDPKVTINEPSDPTTPSCNLSEVQGFIDSELERTAEMYSRDEEEIRLQVFQLQEAFADFAANIRRRRAPMPLISEPTTAHQPISEPTATPLPMDCTEVATRGVAESGVHMVQPRDGGAAIEVYCDMDTDGGGWTVFQRRQDGSVDFYRDFEGYRQGFGDLDGEFWLGNDNLHRLTAQDDYILRVDLTDFEGNSTYASYASFNIADPSDFYRLTIEGYSGTAGDSLANHNDKQFTTYDVDNDDWTKNCAEQFVGAWWYAGCYKSHLNGRYVGEPYQGVAWFTWKSNYDSLKASEMKFRKKSF